MLITIDMNMIPAIIMHNHDRTTHRETHLANFDVTMAPIRQPQTPHFCRSCVRLVRRFLRASFLNQVMITSRPSRMVSITSHQAVFDSLAEQTFVSFTRRRESTLYLHVFLTMEIKITQFGHYLAVLISSVLTQ